MLRAIISDASLACREDGRLQKFHSSQQNRRFSLGTATPIGASDARVVCKN